MLSILSPFSAILQPISLVADPVFSAALAGPGFSLIPTCQVQKSFEAFEEVLSPCSGEVVRLMNHASVLKVQNFSWPILVHLGIDTVKKGEEFITPLVSAGQYVQAGQPLFSWNLTALIQAGLDPTTVIIALQCPQKDLFADVQKRKVNSSELLFTVPDQPIDA